MKILVTGAGAVLGQGIIRALLGSSLKPTIVAADPGPLSAGLYWVDSAHLVPMARDSEYGARVSEVLEKEKPDAVLIGTDVELKYFAAHREELEQRHSTKIVVSKPRVIEIADDKWETFRFLRDAGFAHPDSSLPADVSQLVDRVGYPLVVKPRRGARSIGLSVVNNAAELARALAGSEDAVVQECVGTSDQEYTAGLICYGGKCCASITMRRDLRDGNTYRAYPVPRFEHDVVLRRIAEELGVEGPVNLQFRLDGNQVKVFEINGRFSGTTPLRALVGFPEVEMILRYVLLGEPVQQPEIRDDVVLRHWSETVVPRKKLLGCWP